MEDRLCSFTPCTLEAARQDDVMILLLSPDDLLEGAVGSIDEDSSAHSLRAPRRLTLAELEACIASAPREVRVTELTYFNYLFTICSTLSHRCRTIINSFDALRKREKVQESDKKRLYSYAKVRRFVSALQRFPIDLPLGSELAKLIDRVAAWQQEVRALGR